MKLPESQLTKSQKKVFTKSITYYWYKADMIVTIRHDDECGNGHNSFSITGDIYKAGRRSDSAFLTGGCIHEEIEKHFPELTQYIKWHMTSTDGPMYYLANSLYHASDKDYKGKRAGEPSRFETRLQIDEIPYTLKFRESFIHWLAENRSRLNDLEVLGIDHDDRETFGTKYTLGDYGTRWHDCPFDNETDALAFLKTIQEYPFYVVHVVTAYSEGKTPDLEAARNSAVWPDAELKDFTKEKLEARLPVLMKDFKQAVESLGLVY